MATVERYAAPRSLEEALQLLAEQPSTLLAGGTDLLPQTRARKKELRPLLLSISRVNELKGVSESDGVIRIGALTTVAEICRDGLLRSRVSILPFTANCFASGQVRNSATIGGNICNASPAGDMIIPLLLLDATVELASWVEGRVSLRAAPLCDFFVAPGMTTIKSNEIMMSIRFSAPGDSFFADFRKFGTRPAMDISIVSAGISGQREKDVITHVRVAFGAVAPVPLRGRRTEAILEGHRLVEARVNEAVRMAEEEVSPISDVRASAWYRRELVRTLARRMIQNVGQA